ncbi:MAG: AI-2E family transporter, partial [Myxococcota bacterium]
MSSANPAPPRSGLLLTRVSVGLLLLLGTFLILRSFIVPILWASVVVFMTWGLYERACRMSGRPQLTAGLFTLSVLLLFGIPSLWVLISLAEQTAGLVRAAQGWISAGAPLPGWLMDIGWLGPRIEELRSQALQGTGELGPHLVRLGRGLSEQLIGVARGAVQSALSFLITLVTAFVLYVNGRNVVEGARRLMLHIFPDRPPDF